MPFVHDVQQAIQQPGMSIEMREVLQYMVRNALGRRNAVNLGSIITHLGTEMTETNKPPSGSKAEAESRCSGCARMPPGWIVFLILGGILALGYVFLR